MWGGGGGGGAGVLHNSRYDIAFFTLTADSRVARVMPPCARYRRIFNPIDGCGSSSLSSDVASVTTADQSSAV